MIKIKADQLWKRTVPNSKTCDGFVEWIHIVDNELCVVIYRPNEITDKNKSGLVMLVRIDQLITNNPEQYELIDQ